MKYSNVKYSAIAIDDNSGKVLKCKFFCSEQAKNNWCNRQYGNREDVTVEVYDEPNSRLIETWHA